MTDSIIQIKDLQFKPFISESTLMDRIAVVSQQIRADYQDKNPVFVSILNGAFVFTADLIRQVGVSCEIAFTRLASYSGMESTGVVKTLLDLEVDLKGRHVIVVEDIVDTGQTLKQFLGFLQEKQPASVSVAALLVKPDALQHHFDIDYLCFNIPNKFVVGYGMDYDEAGRELKAIYQLFVDDRMSE